jgi:hypothetical protein
MRVVSR